MVHTRRIDRPSRESSIAATKRERSRLLVFIHVEALGPRLSLRAHPPPPVPEYPTRRNTHRRHTTLRSSLIVYKQSFFFFFLNSLDTVLHASEIIAGLKEGGDRTERVLSRWRTLRSARHRKWETLEPGHVFHIATISVSKRAIRNLS